MAAKPGVPGTGNAVRVLPELDRTGGPAEAVSAVGSGAVGPAAHERDGRAGEEGRGGGEDGESSHVPDA
jgi:hypothetical protein